MIFKGKTEIDILKSYLLKYPSFSNKKQRIFLIDRYYELKSIKAYSALPDSPLGKAW